MRTKLLVGVCALALAFTAACGGDTTNSNANANSTNATTNTRSSVDGAPTMTSPEYETTVTEEGGVKTETRTYRNNTRIQRVVITTRGGKRTAIVYNARGEQRELAANDLDNVLAKSGDEIANAAGFVADKAEDVAGKTVEAGKEVGKEVADKGEDVADKTVEGAKKVGEKTAEGAKTAGKKTVEGAKKVGGAVKDAITP